ncbi:MAG TPA: neocarzinostatin apoprotein domain-containing protein [Acidimicrobiales bacterium]
MLSLCLWALVASQALPAAAAAKPQLHAVPATGLHRGSVVEVSGSGFRPRDQVFLVECLASATGQGQCDISTATPATISAKGVLPRTRFKVVTGKVGSGTCGTTTANRGRCVINAGNAKGGDTATVAITFAAPHRATK